jgi:hypothetical protein
MADGLSANQLRELVDEHGSLEAAIEARPDLAVQLRGVQQLAEKFGKTAAAAARMSKNIRPAALMRVREPKPLLVENKVETQAAAFELALARHDQAQMRKAKAKKRKHGPDPHPIPRAAVAKVLAGLEGGTKKLTEIEQETGVDIHDVRKLRDWRNGRGYEMHPGPIANTVILRKV